MPPAGGAVLDTVGVLVASGVEGVAESPGPGVAVAPLSKSSPPAVFPPVACVAIAAVSLLPLPAVPVAGLAAGSEVAEAPDEEGAAGGGEPFPNAFIRARVFSASSFLFCFL